MIRKRKKRIDFKTAIQIDGAAGKYASIPARPEFGLGKNKDFTIRLFLQPLAITGTHVLLNSGGAGGQSDLTIGGNATGFFFQVGAAVFYSTENLTNSVKYIDFVNDAAAGQIRGYFGSKKVIEYANSNPFTFWDNEIFIGKHKTAGLGAKFLLAKIAVFNTCIDRKAGADFRGYLRGMNTVGNWIHKDFGYSVLGDFTCQERAGNVLYDCVAQYNPAKTALGLSVLQNNHANLIGYSPEEIGNRAIVATNYLANRDFSVAATGNPATGWLKQAAWTFDTGSNVANCSGGDGNNLGILQTNVTLPKGVYYITVPILSVTAGALDVFIVTADGQYRPTGSGQTFTWVAGEHKLAFDTPGGEGSLYLTGFAGFAGSIAPVTIYEHPESAKFIQSARKDIYTKTTAQIYKTVNNAGIQLQFSSDSKRQLLEAKTGLPTIKSALKIGTGQYQETLLPAITSGVITLFAAVVLTPESFTNDGALMGTNKNVGDPYNFGGSIGIQIGSDKSMIYNGSIMAGGGNGIIPNFFHEGLNCVFVTIENGKGVSSASAKISYWNNGALKYVNTIAANIDQTQLERFRVGQHWWEGYGYYLKGYIALSGFTDRKLSNREMLKICSNTRLEYPINTGRWKCFYNYNILQTSPNVHVSDLTGNNKKGEFKGTAFTANELNPAHADYAIKELNSLR